MTKAKIAGCTVPLFSLRTRRSWGIGQITDLVPFAEWLVSGGIHLLQILPPHELAAGESSPYGARTAFGLDPIYIDVEAVPDLDAAAIDDVLGEEGKKEVARLRATSSVDYAAVRSLKTRVLRRAFDHFYAREWQRGTPRARALSEFIARESAWAKDLALYVAIRESHAEHGWDNWPEPERRRDPETLARLAEMHAPRILEHQYAQWIALEQWERAREGLRAASVELMGDLPFVVGHESADVWANARQFQPAPASLGAPPDGFSPEGQDWGLPPFDWAAMDADDLLWIRARTRHAAKLYDRFRLDHVVGLFRMFVIKGQHRAFDPPDEQAQRARGQRVLSAMAESARPAKIVAEDLGVIPDFVRETLSAMSIPGYKVIPWERDFQRGMYNPPKGFPEVSIASWSTHDTAPITSWWHELQDWEREDLSKLIGIGPNANDEERWHALMRALYEARSDITLVLVQEILGEGRRINTPGTVGPENWTYRLPAPIEELSNHQGIVKRMQTLRSMAVSTGRAR